MRRSALLALVAALALALPAAAAPVRPAVSFQQILAAAKSGRTPAVWAGLSAATRAHYGTLASFKASPEWTRLHGASRSPYSPLVDQTFPDGGAVEAVKTYGGGYAGAMRLEGGRWKLQLDPEVLLQPLSPRPGPVKGKVVQAAAQAMLPEPADTGALFLDGKALPTRGGATNGGRTVTLYANVTQTLSAGRHTLVAYIRGGAHAGALAWSFTVR